MLALFNPEKPFELPELPPNLNPDAILNHAHVKLLVKANSALADLKGTCRAISRPEILLNIPTLQESVASSEIEGIHTTVETALEEQVKAANEQDPASKEALRYRGAINAGFTSLGKYALSTRTILEIHSELMESGGRFRDKQNKIAKGGSKVIYTPPSVTNVERLMSNWEKYVHSKADDFDPIIKMAICHYQFEAIHPFSDGNGRTGRILMVLQLVQDGLLDFPILYLSGYLNRHRDDYYRLLHAVTAEGKWMEYIEFMLTGACEQAEVTRSIIEKVVQQRDDLKHRLRKEFASIYSHELLEHIFSYPVTYPTHMAEKLGIAYQTASKHLALLDAAGVLKMRKSGRHTFYYNVGLLSCLRT